MKLVNHGLVCGLIAAMGIASLPCFAAAEKVVYPCSGVVERQHRNLEDLQYRDAGSVSRFSFGILPCIEWPSAENSVHGLSFNLFSGEHYDVHGVDFGLISNYVTRELIGFQFSPCYNDIGESRGAMQFSLVLNRCNGTMHGFQFGLVNVAERGDGFQLGVINYGNEYRGLQLGVVNIVLASRFPVLPIVNFAF